MKKILALSLTFILMVVAFGTVATAATGTLTQNPVVGSYEWAGITNWWRAYAQQSATCSEGHSLTYHTTLAFNNGTSHAAYSQKVDRPYPSDGNKATGTLKVSCVQCGTNKSREKTTSRPSN